MVKCDECGKDATNYYDFEGKKLCMGCSALLEQAHKSAFRHRKDKKLTTF